ncbi:MAG TPA: hypothetical protein PKX71_04070 [Candidatus Avimonas sp.]|jgi:hypothetical protein|nr:hypothetical protein [Clostridiales bacterium]HOB36653.1 hypothetical protein [Candidatus Avimonas sp.]HQA16117.1 hypothetical protein [Candidatus Avimonas sp.]HQD38180.1 hypothetical protein [Candidatus Avimonas sp.]
MKSLKNAARLLLFALVVSACLIIPAVAASPALEEFDNPDNDYIKIYLITERDGQGVVMEKPERRVFWEYPLLSAGQTRTGTLYIKNETQNSLDFSKSSINLPYDDQQALLYIVNLKISVLSSSGEPLYQGSYGSITESFGNSFKLPPLDPGETGEFTITLSCPFYYTGTPENQTAAVEWKITPSNEDKNGLLSRKTVLVFSICALVVITAVIAAGLIRSRRAGRN